MILVLFRLLLSGIIAFFFYAAWAYYANSLVSDDEQVLYKAALVQGSYSGGITLVFTFVLELFYKVFKNKTYCLPFIVPNISVPNISVPNISAPSFFKFISSGFKSSADKDLGSAFASSQSATASALESSLQASEKAFNGVCVPGIVLTPLPAIALQSVFVISVNVVFMTPNLWLTVAPSIFFSAIYGYVYTISLNKKLKRAQA